MLSEHIARDESLERSRRAPEVAPPTAIQRNASNSDRSALAAPEHERIAIGPDIVLTGEFLGVDNAEWSFHLHHFVDGDVRSLIAFIERYGQTTAIDRYVLVNHLGDGRALKGTPSMTRGKAGGYIVRCPVLPGADRIRAADLPKDFALSDNHDLTVKSGTIAMVSGLEALPQRIKTCLSHQKGESPFHRDFGTRFAEYYRLLSDSPWFEDLLKLEIIRQAAIPYIDTVNNRQYTPLLCVEHVYGIEILANAPNEKLATDSGRPRCQRRGTVATQFVRLHSTRTNQEATDRGAVAAIGPTRSLFPR
jgi:hypothetical protein